MTKLIITGKEEEGFSMGGAQLADDGTYAGSKGGTEMMRDALFERVDKDLLEPFNFVISRVIDEKLDKDKINLLWLHDTWDDPQSQHLSDQKSRDRFGKLIFVSNYQLATYNQGLGVPYSESVVIKNAIVPISMPEDKNGFLERKSKDGPLRLIYHTTPHRGLDILVACFERLVDHSDLELHLDVFSSFKIYGWDKQDQMFEDVFQKCRDHPNITYHGYQPNDVVRDALKDAHIYAYPNIWPETSCISVLEAMSAGCVVVCPNYAGLPETTANWATMYPWHEDPMQHAQLFVNLLNNIVENYWNEDVQLKLAHQKMYIDNFYNWDLRAAEWTGLLQGLIASLRYYELPSNAREIIEKSEG